MEDPDELPRVISYTFFAARVGQAMQINGLPAPTTILATPPIGLDGDRVILVHLEGSEDWSPSSLASGSGMSSDHGSLGPWFIPFDWARGALDGTPNPGQRV